MFLPPWRNCSGLLGDPAARVLAGGTDLFVAMRDKGLRPPCLVDIKRIPELRGIKRLNGGGLSVGATTTLHEIETSQDGEAGLSGAERRRGRRSVLSRCGTAEPSAAICRMPPRPRTRRPPSWFSMPNWKWPLGPGHG